ncbi:hypothetical protein PC128_g8754 [Phytophthora cactorum]|nr:hypothetical protein PC120_g3284 [Phytophthora cactorum]KAG3195121.1 hypothetical protein PC128_g8754 [Phytophthora cactorum]
MMKYVFLQVHGHNQLRRQVAFAFGPLRTSAVEKQPALVDFVLVCELATQPCFVRSGFFSPPDSSTSGGTFWRVRDLVIPATQAISASSIGRRRFGSDPVLPVCL